MYPSILPLIFTITTQNFAILYGNYVKTINSTTDISRLNAKQKETVVCEEKRVLVLACAGSGKTKTLLQKIVWLINEKKVKPFESTTKDTALFSCALQRIIKGRLSVNYEMETALSFEEEFKYYHEEVKDFCRQVSRVIDMVKVENLDFEWIYKKSQNDQHERIRLIYQLAATLFKKYSAYCLDRSFQDFNDMIIRTIFLLKKQPEIREKLSVSGKTIHAAKGLEADAVFIIGLTEAYGGFPDIRLDDRIFQVIKKAKHNLMLGDEQRLFFVP